METEMTKRKWYSGMLVSEDWWAVWISLFIIIIALLGIFNIDLLGWIATPRKWIFSGENNLAAAIAPVGAKYSSLGFAGSIIITYTVLLLLFMIVARSLRYDTKKFFVAWTLLFVIVYFAWLAGQYAFFAADPTNKAKYGFDKVLSLGSGASYIMALITGLVIGNFFKPLAEIIKPAAKPELYIKIAIVFIGVEVGMHAFSTSGFIFDLAIAGAAATIVAYLIFWPGTYLIARKVFHMPRKTSAVMASGISVCGVSAAVATAGAVRAKPLIPVMVSALIVIYAVIELVIIPPVFTRTMLDEPVVAGAAMGMSIKTDGADAAAGAMMDEMMRGRKLNRDGVEWAPGYITASAVMTKLWIDMFIGVWAFILAIFWLRKVDRKPGEKVPASEIWHRFPKFVLGYILAWFIFLGLLWIAPDLKETVEVSAKPLQKGFRLLFFMMTFVSIGVITDFRKLAEARFGKMVYIYLIALTVFILPVALIIAWIFHHGMMVPTV